MRKINTVKGALIKDLSPVNMAVTGENTKVTKDKEVLEDKKFSNILASNYKNTTGGKDVLSKKDLMDKSEEVNTNPKNSQEDAILRLLNTILTMINVNDVNSKDFLKKVQSLIEGSNGEGISSMKLIFNKDESLSNEENIEVKIKELVSLMDSDDKNQENIKSLLAKLKPETLESLSAKLVDMKDRDPKVHEFYNILKPLSKSQLDRKKDSNFINNENATEEKVSSFTNTPSFQIEENPLKDKLPVRLEDEGCLNEDKSSSSKELKLLEDIINQKDKPIKDMQIDKLLNRMNISSNSLKGLGNLEINGQDTVKEVVRVIKFMDKANIKELTLKINPKELGTITIKLTMEAGIMKANLTPTNKDTYNLLNKNLSELKSLMSDSNIKVQEVSINIYNDDTTYFSSNFNENSFAQNQKDRNTSGENKNNSFIEENFNEEDHSDVLEVNSTVNMLA